MVGVRCRTTPVSITGVDIVRNNGRQVPRAEDNLRVPSGVSYMLMNRKMMMRLFPELFLRQTVRPVELPGTAVADAEGNRYRQPDGGAATPGRFNSAPTGETHFPRAADGRGAGRRAGSVRQGRLRLHACTSGPQRVDVMYAASTTCSSIRSRSAPIHCSALPGLFNAYVKGNIVICNAIGTGVADDKSIYPYVPDA